MVTLRQALAFPLLATVVWLAWVLGRQAGSDAVAVLLAEIGPTTPYMLELRHLGGALARPPAVTDAVGHRDAGFTVFTSAYPGPAFEAAAVAQTAMYERLLPWSGGRSLYNFTARPDGRPADARGAFDEPTLARRGRAAGRRPLEHSSASAT